MASDYSLWQVCSISCHPNFIDVSRDSLLSAKRKFKKSWNFISEVINIASVLSICTQHYRPKSAWRFRPARCVAKQTKHSWRPLFIDYVYFDSVLILFFPKRHKICQQMSVRQKWWLLKSPKVPGIYVIRFSP